jgi:hypothetical protein
MNHLDLPAAAPAAPGNVTHGLHDPAKQPPENVTHGLHRTDGEAPARLCLAPRPLARLAQAGPPAHYAVRLVQAGPTRAAGDRPGRLVVEAAAIRDAVSAGLFDGRPMFIDHAGLGGGASLRDLAAVVLASGWNEAEQAAEATIRLYDTEAGRLAGALLAELMADQASGRPAPDVGISLVFWPTLQAGPGDGQSRVVAFRAVESADFVFQPAAGGRVQRALAALSQSGDFPMTHSDPTERPTPAAPLAQPAGDSGGLLAAASPWLDALRDGGRQAMLAASGLPEATRRRLLRADYPSPQALAAAIEEARAELAAATELSVVQIGGQPPRGPRLSGMVAPLDQAQSAVNWLFGVPNSALPEPTLRKADLLYVALTGDANFHGRFDGDRLAFAGATTATLPNLAVNALNKVVQSQFSDLAHWRWYERIVFVTANDGSLEPMQWITVGGMSNLPTVAEGASYEELAISDAGESSAFVKRGGYIGITREMIMNSDIQRIQAVPRGLAQAALRTRSAAIAAIFTANAGVGPTLTQDSKALFHADHGNLDVTALGTDATAWRAARAECFKQAELGSGKRLGVYPKYLLVPAELYDQALAILGYGEGMPTTYTPEAQDRGFADPRAIPLVVPDWTDATDWAYIVDPAVYPVIMMSYSQAPGGGIHPAPELFSVLSESAGLLFTNDTLPIKVRDEFAAGVSGPRGIGKRNAV